MKFIKNILDYLFVKYYWFQVKVGNADIAHYTSIIIIVSLCVFFCPLILMMLLSIIFRIKIESPSECIYVIIYVLSLIFFYFLYINKGKYQKIIERENLKNRSNLGAILFPTLVFILMMSLFVLGKALK